MTSRLIFFNSLIFLLWKVASYIPEFLPFLEDNFLVSWQSLAEGRWWTLILSEFSHSLFLHFLVNMFVLQSFGRILERVIGSRRLFILYVMAAIAASIGHSLVSKYLLEQPELPALGASGAISGLVLVFSLMFPREIILIFGLIPVPAIFGAFAFIGLDIWGLVTQIEGQGLPIGHGAHLGGALFGILYFLFYLFNRRTTAQKSIYSH